MIEFFNDLLFVCIDLGVDNLLSQVIDLVVNLSIVTVNLIFSDCIVIKSLLFWSVPELFVVEHELLCFCVLNNGSCRRIFLVNDWHVSSGRFIHNVPVLVKVGEVLKHGVRVLITASTEETIAIFSKTTHLAI